MLSIGKLSGGQQEYYEKAVAQGVEEYYVGKGEAPGYWIGEGSELLGLEGVVEHKALDAVLAGRHPGTDEKLLAAATPKVIGYDATFCAPKSVSLLYALGTPEVAAEVRAAHDTAVAAAFSVCEKEAARARRGHAGATVLEADGFVAAAFPHRTSRAGDPHLHTHVLIAYPVHSGGDGRWSALDARRLYPWAKPVGHLYEAHLRAELTRRLGVEWGPVKNGIADIVSVTRHVIDAFSQRRAEIEAHLEEHGQSSPRAAQVATYATRRAKDHSTTTETLLERWWAKADELGLTPEAVGQWIGRGRELEPLDVNDARIRQLFELLASPDGLTERRSTFDRQAVVREIADVFRDGAEVSGVVALADAFLQSPDAVALPLRDPSGHLLRRRDGTTVVLEEDFRRYSTPELLAIERRLLAIAAERAGTSTAQMPSHHLSLPMHTNRLHSLSKEQAAMVVSLLRSGNGVDVVVGAAGTGKTTALRTARELWEYERKKVIGCALAARAAAQLQEGAGIPSSTIDRLLTSAARIDGRLDADVLVVDEAGMVGTRQLARILDLAGASGTKVVLVGDHRQLPEINAGGAFAALAHELPAVSLQQNRRQVEQWERAALSMLRAGDAERAVDLYLAAGRVRAGDDSVQVRAAMVNDWWSVRATGQDVLMLATRRSQVEALNRLARSRLREEGSLGNDEICVDGRAFAVGDAIIVTRNDYRVGLRNGDRAEVISTDPQARQLTVHTADGRLVELGPRHLAATRLAHGYATTIHKAQGATVDVALLLVDDRSYREAAYTGLSRGRITNSVYVVSQEADDRLEVGRIEPPGKTPVDILRQSVARSGAQELGSYAPSRGPVLER